MPMEMSGVVPSQVPSIDELRTVAAVRVHSLLQTLSEHRRVADELDVLRTTIESLPLATVEFGVAMNRLRNVKRYLCSDEPGAASYEVRLLLGSLRWC